MIKFLTFIFVYILSIGVMATEFKVTDVLGAPASGIAVYLIPQDESKLNDLWANQTNTASTKTIISQENKKFSPYLSVTSKQNPIVFDNKDDITHHIYSIDKENSFDFKLRSGEQKSDISFAKKTTIAMGCNIHDWMAGHLLIVDTPFYGITNIDGKVVFSDLPDIGFKLKLFHPQLSEVDNDREITFTLTTKPFLVKLIEPITATPLQQDTSEFDFVEGYE